MSSCVATMAMAAPAGSSWGLLAPRTDSQQHYSKCLITASLKTQPAGAGRWSRSGLKGEAGEGKLHWQRCRRLCASRARVTCIGGDMNKRDAARKALESALGEKKDAFSKWDEEIKKREAGGGGGKGRGRGWGSGGSGGGGDGEAGSSSNSDSWEEAKQILFAFTGLAALYLVLTKGKSMLAFTVNSILFVLRGFKSSVSSSSPRREPSGPVPIDGPGPAESNVMSKWGKD